MGKIRIKNEKFYYDAQCTKDPRLKRKLRFEVCYMGHFGDSLIRNSNSPFN